MTTKPFRFQAKGVRKIHHFRGRALLADDMGLGKTLQALLFSKELDMRPVIIVCPAYLRINWQREAMMHIGARSLIIESHKVPKRYKRTGIKTNRLIIISYTVLGSWLKVLRKNKPRLVIIDECQNIANPRAQRSRNTRKLCKGVRRIIAISGTPINNRPVEIYNVANLLRPDRWNSFWEFATRYCRPKMTPWGWRFPGAAHLTELNQRLNTDMMIRRRTEDVMKDLPKNSRSVLMVPLSNQREYDRANKDFIGWLMSQSKSKAIRASKAQHLAKWGYLKRLAAQGKLPAVLDWLDTLLEDTNQKVVLFGIHRFFSKAILERFGEISVLIDGTVSPKKRQRAVDVFQEDKRKRLCMANLVAGGTGITLTAANKGGMGELSWVPAEHLQAEKRINRIGQTMPTHWWYLVAEKTIEVDLCDVLERKQKILTGVLDGGRTIDDDLDVFSILEKRFLRRIKNGRLSSA